ncbi:hypothetical protein C8R30_13211 [Nitrosomonas nitrosa]|uniref:hypothetical protein n=1 Tax=Nitrosomonas nitrosa TaxID=52442 RepID=UPI000D30B360|nr:hypothetical protein [Nitrosomonas nitrosa]PTQ91467.1 hypothetical protein C8R30_13211 [Nitrosomonas nitrosa]
MNSETLVNYNHSHALTILYYEVLRHFRVVTEYIRSRPIILVKLDTNFMSEENLAFVPRKPSENPIEKIEYLPKFLSHLKTQQNLLENRPVLEAALLDTSHIEGFNALKRAAHRHNVAALTLPPLSPPVFSVPSFRFFVFDMKTGGIYDDKKDRNISIKATIWPEGHQLLNEDERLSPIGAFGFPNANNSFIARLPDNTPPVPWSGIEMIKIYISIGNQKTGHDISFSHITITGIDENGLPTKLVDKNYEAEGGHLVLGNSDSIRLWTFRPLTPPPSPPPPRPFEEIEDDAKINELIGHLRYHRAHYSRALYLNQNTAERARQLNEIKLLHDATLLEKVENRPLEMLGDFIAYPCANSDWARTIKGVIDRLPLLDDQKLDERLVTLPTRGIFAEAKLGHCNASEEIDNNRFWDWQQSPIPHMAPDIAAIQAGQHLLKDMNLQSSSIPQSMVNIVNPSAAPDPTGLAAAMNVFGTPNIFRDMSGRAEVADLLKKLSDNSISIAEAANKAKEIQAKYGGDSVSSAGKGNGGGGRASSSVGGPRARPTEPSAANRDLHDMMNLTGNAVNRNLMSPETAQELTEQAFREAYTPESLFQNIANHGQQPPAHPAQQGGVTDVFLQSIATVNFTNSTDIDNFFQNRTNQHFIDWFNTTLAGKGDWIHKRIAGDTPQILKQRFTNFWDNIPIIFGGQIGLIQFVCLMSLAINEINGNLISKTEQGRGGRAGHKGLAYFFDPIKDVKGSYNVAPNKTALECFNNNEFIKEHGHLKLGTQLQKTKDAVWNETKYPSQFLTDENPDINGFIMQADFYKYRGRGIIQITWRNAYEQLVNFIKTGYTGASPIILKYRNAWQNLTNDSVLWRSTTGDWDHLFGDFEFVCYSINVFNHWKGDFLTLNLTADELNGQGRGSIYNVGLKMNGKTYAATFRRRVIQILDALGNQQPASSSGGGVGNTPETITL